MAATLRELRGRIRSAGSIKKITKAQEMIATSRIGKAQARLQAARPYAAEITKMLTTLAAEAALDHPLLVEHAEPKRAGVLVVSSDRGLCGAYNSSAFRRAEELFSLLRSDGKTPVLYTVGRKALGYYTFRNWDIAESWTGFSERPSYEDAAKVAETLVDAFMAGAEEDGERADRDGQRALAIVDLQPGDADGADRLMSRRVVQRLVVGDQHIGARRVRHFRHGLQVNDGQRGIGRRFQEQDAGVGLDGGLPLGDVAAIDQGISDAEARQDFLHHMQAGPEHGARRHDMIARLHHRQQRR